ncbi:MAG: TonB family protein [Candidatus Eisenbacteria bacterium]|nr:TonB family protein [Candidatus Eisenbacteria bacterium]
MTTQKSAASPLDFSFAERLPVVGEMHPLRRRYQRFLYWSIGVASAVHLLIFGAWLVARSMEKEVERPREVQIVSYRELGVPPSLAQETAASAQVAIAQQIAPPSLGVPEPVPDFQATTSTIATQEQLAEAFVPTTLSSLDGAGGDSLVVIPDAVTSDNPSPDEFVAVEEMPVLIQIPPPIYPDMARQAEVEGTVMVRALVGKDGKVADAFVTDGVPMLNDAAVAAARKAVFKPALQQHKPVAVWVQIPMRFSLN